MLVEKLLLRNLQLLTFLDFVDLNFWQKYFFFMNCEIDFVIFFLKKNPDNYQDFWGVKGDYLKRNVSFPPFKFINSIMI